MRSRNVWRGGFTLIELLVVVAIIALLISILLPSLRAARDQAKQLLCQTNLRTMGQGAFFYAEQNEDYIVHAETDNTHFVAALMPGMGYVDVDPRQLWRRGNKNRFRNALRDAKLFQCPTHPQPDQLMDYVVNAFPTPYDRRPGDNPNGETGDCATSDNSPRLAYSRLSQPGSTVLIDGTANNNLYTDNRLIPPSAINSAERVYITEAHECLPEVGEQGWAELNDLFVFAHLPFATRPRVANDRRHPGGVGAVFFDGHAEIVPFRELDSGFGRRIEDRIRRFAYFKPRYAGG